MNKEQLTARCEELGIDVQALNAANKKGTATNADLKAAIDAREAELHTEALIAKATELGIENLEELDTDAKLQEAIDALSPAENPKTADKGVEDEEEATITYTDSSGRVWMFHPKAPKTINMDGRSRSQAEILEAEELISELAYGNSSLLIQKHD